MVAASCKEMDLEARMDLAVAMGYIAGWALVSTMDLAMVFTGGCSKIMADSAMGCSMMDSAMD